MGTLYVVATPIGNLEDITLRALRVLREADLLLAEDTRRTRILLDRYEIRKRPVSLHAHNEAARCEQVLAALREDRCVALVSDAGTPLVSDPGERLVEAALADEHAVVAVPGASAVLAALAVSGLPVGPFTFLGFLPRRARARDDRLAAFRDRPETLVVFESPRRLAATLRALLDALGDRPGCVARELTKRHEEVVRGSLSELVERFSEGARGEVVVVVGGAEPRAADSRATPQGAAAFDARIRALLHAGWSPREIAAELSRETRTPKRELYARSVELRDET
ncbi:MAG: 16S rRNA (cytidine(1402)-2'-O)-methyltransferase [Deltaproteobacteria bacterium]|nr:MAG: 16S rRNA (cytidine(1402)-2'-O)-methyltransferase [Deltaproteobacteria bacterium]